MVNAYDLSKHMIIDIRLGASFIFHNDYLVKFFVVHYSCYKIGIEKYVL